MKKYYLSIIPEDYVKKCGHLIATVRGIVNTEPREIRVVKPREEGLDFEAIAITCTDLRWFFEEVVEAAGVTPTADCAILIRLDDESIVSLRELVVQAGHELSDQKVAAEQMLRHMLGAHRDHIPHWIGIKGTE